MRIDWRFPASILCVVALCSSIGIIRRPICSDCFRFHGWPFPYYREGGFAGGAHWVWGGMLGDFLVCFTLGILLWQLLKAFSKSRMKQVNPQRHLMTYVTWGWIRILYGIALILDLFGVLWNQMHGYTRPALMPSNDQQGAGEIIAYALIACAAYWLILNGLRRVTKPPAADKSTSPSSSLT